MVTLYRDVKKKKSKNYDPHLLPEEQLLSSVISDYIGGIMMRCFIFLIFISKKFKHTFCSGIGGSLRKIGAYEWVRLLLVKVVDLC